MTYSANLLRAYFNPGPGANLSAGASDHTVVANAKVIVVAVYQPSVYGMTSVDVEGNAATKAVESAYLTSGNEPRISVWYLLDPPTGANITITVTSDDNDGFAEGYMVWEIMGPINVSGIGGTAAANYGGTDSNSPSVSLTTDVADSAVFYAITNKSGTGANMTDNSTPAGEPLVNVNRGDIDAYGGIIKAGGSAGSKTVGATMAASNDWAIAAFELKYSEYVDDGNVTRIGLTEQTISNAGNPSHSHSAPSGSSRLLVALVTHEDSTDPSDITAITYGGKSLSKALEQVVDPGTFTDTAEVWYLLESDIAAASGSSFVITFTGGNPDQGTVITTQFYRNVKQGVPGDTSGDGTSSNDGTGLTISIDELDGGLVVGTGFHGASAGIDADPTGYTEIDIDLDTGSQGHSHASYDKLPTAEALNQSRLIDWASAQRVGVIWASWEAAASSVPVVRRLETGTDFGATAARLDGVLVA